MFIGLLILSGLLLFGFSNRSEEKKDTTTPIEEQKLNAAIEAELVEEIIIDEEINEVETTETVEEVVEEDVVEENDEVLEVVEYEIIEQPEEGVEVVEIEEELIIDYSNEILDTMDATIEEEILEIEMDNMNDIDETEHIDTVDETVIEG